MSIRVVYIDLVDDYSIEVFLFVLRWFIFFRGYFVKLYFDNGLQLVVVSEEFQNVMKKWNLKEFEIFGVNEGLKWEFIFVDVLWQNGILEVFVKLIK